MEPLIIAEPDLESVELDNGSGFYREKAKEFVELHDQVQTSISLLDTLETFLSTFQKDLSVVSGQIFDLQGRSKDIENRLKSRRKIEKPLSNLISDIVIPPSLVTLILDSDVGDTWISAVGDLERRLDTYKSRTRVKAARDMGDVAEGLRIVAVTKLRAFFFALFHPFKSDVTTNMQVIQTSVLMKYKTLFTFLQRQAPTVAQEVQRSYVGGARMYYETGFRRYARSLGWIKSRTAQKLELIISNKDEEWSVDTERLACAGIEGPRVTLAYMADDKAHKEPVEALLRSLLLVLMDNATAEYTFVSNFFTSDLLVGPPDSHSSLPSPASLDNSQSKLDSDSDDDANITNEVETKLQRALTKVEQANTDAIWKQVLDPVLEYCQSFVRSVLDPIPRVVTLLTMIRLTEDIVGEVRKRKCPPLEAFVFGLGMQIWPVFQTAMSEHIESLKKLAESSGAGYFSRSVTISEGSLATICQRYSVLFISFIALTQQAEETMIFNNLSRLRQELVKLVTKYIERVGTDTVTKAKLQSNICERLLQTMRGASLTPHPKLQQEIAFWAEKEEEARRRILSVAQSRR